MTANVLQICPSCAENNSAEWKNPRNTAPLFLATCGVCKTVTPCTHIQFWKGIRSDQPEWKLPREVKKVAPKKAPAATPPSQSDLLNGER